MRVLRPRPRKEVLTAAEWEFLENLKVMREARRRPDFEGDSARAVKRQDRQGIQRN